MSAGAIVLGLFLVSLIIAGAQDGGSQLPLPVRLVIAFFTIEAVRMFVQVVIGATFYQSWHGHETAQNMPRSLVSVIVPAWNEEVGIRKTLDSVLVSTYRPLEVVVVDDGSTDGTANVVEGYIARYGDVVRLVRQANAGKGAAINAGVRHSRGRIIVNLDADSFVQPDAIANLVRRFADPHVDAVVGRIVIGNRGGWVGRMQWLEYQFGFHLRRTQSVLGSIHILSGAMCAYRRSVYKLTPGFRDYSRTEDMDFSLLLRMLRMKLVYADDAVCVTEGASDLRGLHSQRVRWRYGALSCLWHHRRLFFDRRRPNKWLGFYELPASILGYAQILLYPLVLALAVGLPLATGDYIYLLLIFLALPMNFVIVFARDGTLRKQWMHLPTATVLMNAAMLVEFVAMLDAMRRHLLRGQLSWTRWQRTGVDISPLVAFPAFIHATDSPDGELAA